jgi:glucan phosphoethanolaminetransferase (alkaline phosphatase superfamily)
MTKRRKALLWVGLCLSLPGAAYAGITFIYYAWRESPAWSFGAMLLAVVLAAVFIYCLVALIREANRAYREERNAT